MCVLCVCVRVCVHGARACMKTQNDNCQGCEQPFIMPKCSVSHTIRKTCFGQCQALCTYTHALVHVCVLCSREGERGKGGDGEMGKEGDGV